jgi:hypothetical protein
MGAHSTLNIDRTLALKAFFRFKKIDLPSDDGLESFCDELMDEYLYNIVVSDNGREDDNESFRYYINQKLSI